MSKRFADVSTPNVVETERATEFLGRAVMPDLASVLGPFSAQSVALESVLAVDCHELWARGDDDVDPLAPRAPGHDVAWLRLAPRDKAGYLIVGRMPLGGLGALAEGAGKFSLEALACQMRDFGHDSSCERLVILPANVLDGMLQLHSQSFTLRAVVILSPQSTVQSTDATLWSVQRELFDRGLVGIGRVLIEGGEARCFLASDAVRSPHGLGTASRGSITMSSLGSNGQFANQLFQYAFLKLYALRHGATAAAPAWLGRELFDLDDSACGSAELPRLHFQAFTKDGRELWDRENPPLDVDLWGYFQETPECWREHRPLLRRMFQLSADRREAFDTWRSEVTRGGRRTLVAIHVRRGEYRRLQLKEMPWFQLIPEDWYIAWLRAIWPTLCDPVLFVATDEPNEVLPSFTEFEHVSFPFGSIVQSVPDYVREFEMLKRADYLAIANSSFSRMAAILGLATQKCFIPSFQTRAFQPYEPWIDRGFWARFANKRGTHVARFSDVMIHFEVSDLLFYLREHATLTGIQRVQCEILRNLVRVGKEQSIQAVVRDESGQPWVVDFSALQTVLERIQTGGVHGVEIDRLYSMLFGSAVPLFVRPHDVFLITGAFWGSRGIGAFLQQLKNSGAVVGVYIHDILVVTDPEFFVVRDAKIFAKGLFEIMAFADFVITTSEANKRALSAYMAGRGPKVLPLQVVSLAHELSQPAACGDLSSVVGDICQEEYVLCVGTIEVRKNPSYLFNIWRLMIRSGRAAVPKLVFVGRRGWLTDDFVEQLKSSNYLDGRVVILDKVSDIELAALYRHCLLTFFPSWAEGWGLPVGESLAYGKVTIASSVGAIREVGGDLADYVDPYNPHAGLDVLLRYLDDADLRRRRECEISLRFAPRSWRTVAADFLEAVGTLQHCVARDNGIAAITLPPSKYLAIGSEPGEVSADALAGELSADLICIEGWLPPDGWTVWASEPMTLVRFRVDAPVGSRVHLTLRLCARTHHPCRIRISTDAGADTEVTVSHGLDRLAVLSCLVTADSLIWARMATVATPGSRSDDTGAPGWGLRGLIYFRSGMAAAATTEPIGTEPKSNEPIVDRLWEGQRKLEPPEAEARRAGPQSAVSQALDILLRIRPLDENSRAFSFNMFSNTTNCYFSSSWEHYHDAPIFADRADQQMFFKAQRHAVGAAKDELKLIRRCDQYVSTTRFSEGAVFDRAGVSRAFGYLHTSPPIPWLSSEPNGIRVSEAALAAAPFYDQSYLIFYNGNLHNYYHWMVEGLLSLDVLSRMLSREPNVNLVLPKTMDIHAVIDHRDSLRALGLDRYPIVEAPPNLIRVREAIFIGTDSVQSMPAPCLQDFQQRVAALYARSPGPRNRRLLVARKGPTRKMHNLAAVQDFLGQFGFETIYLEGMAIAEQIVMFQSAEFIIGAHGAGLANLLFCHPGTKVIEFMPESEVRPFFWLISEKLGLVHGMQFCPLVEEHSFQSSVIVDVDKLEALYRMVDAHR